MAGLVLRRLLVLVAAAVLLAGCGTSLLPDDFPADPDGTLDRIRADGVVRAGASPRPGWVEVGDDAPTGREPRLV